MKGESPTEQPRWRFELCSGSGMVLHAAEFSAQDEERARAIASEYYRGDDWQDNTGTLYQICRDGTELFPKFYYRLCNGRYGVRRSVQKARTSRAIPAF